MARFVRDPTLIQSCRQVISFDARTFSLSHGLSEEKGPGNQTSEKEKPKHRLIITRCDLKYFQADYSTPIHLACCQGNLDITKLLVKRGAKIECEDGNGLTPLLR